MPLRLGFIAVLVGIYVAGAQLAAHHAPAWTIATLMALMFLALVAAMYLRVLPAVLALPILAILLTAIAGMHWQDIFTKVVEEGGMRLKTAILAAILGSILAQVVEKTGIAQTAIKKTAELGGDRPMILAVILTLVIAILFTTLGGWVRSSW
jgi:H+/gluconate symporter-like permease